MRPARRRRRSPAARWIVGLVVVVVILNVVVAVADAFYGPPEGPASSSYSTAGDGTAALAGLLARAGHPVVPLRGPLDRARPQVPGTLFVLDPAILPSEDVTALRSFVERGGRLVIGGSNPGWTRGLLGENAPTWRFGGPAPARSLAPVPETAGVTTIDARGSGSWADEASALPVIGSDDQTSVAVMDRGAGRVVLLADASPLQNDRLDRLDNAAFGLALAGADGTPVMFAEGVHGYGNATGLGAIPARWKWALGGLAIAALVWMIAVGRRLGPPEQEARDLPPPRKAYVEALGTTLARTKRPDEATAPIRATVKERISTRMGLGEHAGDRELRAAAPMLGLSGEEIDALFGAASTEREVIAIGSALAKVSGKGAG